MNKRILILGADGYIGWNLMLYLATLNANDVYGVDNFSRRKIVKEVKSDSLIPIESMRKRIKRSKLINLHFKKLDITNYKKLKKYIQKIQPEVIINLAQMPSAPYSMMSAKHATWTTNNNVIGNLNLLWIMKEVCPDAHLIKMGTMGEYGTPNIEIPEGHFTIKYKGRIDTLPFPKQAGSFYHWAKVAETQHTEFACKMWGLKATDMMQGIVYGIGYRHFLSRFDYDGVFGTALNRFIVQTIANEPMTLYGLGEQKRGFIHILDALKCFGLYINNPPKDGEYRVFNQLCEQGKTLKQLARMVKKVGKQNGYNPQIKHIDNPRIEKEKHFYKVNASKIKKLGLKPYDMKKEIDDTFCILSKYKDRVKKDVLLPKVNWK